MRLLVFTAFLVAAECFLLDNTVNNVCNRYGDYTIKFLNRNCRYNPDLYKSTADIILNHGYPVESYRVTTKDGFILNFFRIPYSPKNKNVTNRQPILLQHGSISNSDLFVLTGTSSMALTLSDKGYDVWLGNSRGNFYSKNIHYSSGDKQFWNYTLEDMALYDLPPIFEFIASKTKSTGDIIYIGHSAASLEALMYALRLKDHAKKYVKGFIFVGPAVYVNEDIVLIKIIRLLHRLRIYYMGAHSKLATEICSVNGITMRLCVQIANLFIGSDDNHFKPSEIPLLLSGGDTESVKALNQFVQIADTGKLQYYDDTKVYNLSEVIHPVYMIVGENDILATYPNAERIKAELGSAKKEVYPIPGYNHMNYFYADNLEEAFNPYLKTAVEALTN